MDRCCIFDLKYSLAFVVNREDIHKCGWQATANILAYKHLYAINWTFYFQ